MPRWHFNGQAPLMHAGLASFLRHCRARQYSIQATPSCSILSAPNPTTRLPPRRAKHPRPHVQSRVEEDMAGGGERAKRACCALPSTVRQHFVRPGTKLHVARIWLCAAVGQRRRCPVPALAMSTHGHGWPACGSKDDRDEGYVTGTRVALCLTFALFNDESN